MDNSETLKSVSDATLQRAKQFEADILPRNRMHALLQKWGVLPKKRVFSIEPIVLGTLHKIAPLIRTIDSSVFQQREKLLEANYEAMDMHSETLAMIIAHAIHNKKSDPPSSLVNFVKWNFAPLEIFKMVMVVRNQMEVQNFMNSIIFLRGLNVLEIKETREVSPAVQGS